jgi:hypothetical protein
MIVTRMTRITNANNARIAPCATTAPYATSPDERFLWNCRLGCASEPTERRFQRKIPARDATDCSPFGFFELLVERGVLAPHGAIRVLFA